MIFLNPYYWFMNAWFRRVRLMTTAEMFEARLWKAHAAWPAFTRWSRSA